METQKTKNRQSNLEKEKWSWSNALLDLRLYYKAPHIKKKKKGTHYDIKT